MKTYVNVPVGPMPVLIVCVMLMALMVCCSGCSSATSKKLARDLKAFDALGVSEIVITGKFSHTDYTVTTRDGVRRAEVNHTNIWIPQIKVVRETKE